jgi:hypothetical protein
VQCNRNPSGVLPELWHRCRGRSWVKCAAALHYAEEGARIFAVDRDPERMQETVARVQPADTEIVVDGGTTARCD